MACIVSEEKVELHKEETKDIDVLKEGINERMYRIYPSLHRFMLLAKCDEYRQS